MRSLAIMVSFVAAGTGEHPGGTVGANAGEVEDGEPDFSEI